MSILEAMNEAAQADLAELKWESCYVERVTCCGRIVQSGLEFPGEKKKFGPSYGNTTFERRYEPMKTGGRWICPDCPSKRGVFPASCDRQEATT